MMLVVDFLIVFLSRVKWNTLQLYIYLLWNVYLLIPILSFAVAQFLSIFLFLGKERLESSFLQRVLVD